MGAALFVPMGLRARSSDEQEVVCQPHSCLQEVLYFTVVEEPGTVVMSKVKNAITATLYKDKKRQEKTSRTGKVENG